MMMCDACDGAPVNPIEQNGAATQLNEEVTSPFEPSIFRVLPYELELSHEVVLFMSAMTLSEVSSALFAYSDSGLCAVGDSTIFGTTHPYQQHVRTHQYGTLSATGYSPKTLAASWRFGDGTESKVPPTCRPRHISVFPKVMYLAPLRSE